MFRLGCKTFVLGLVACLGPCGAWAQEDLCDPCGLSPCYDGVPWCSTDEEDWARSERMVLPRGQQNRGDGYCEPSCPVRPVCNWVVQADTLFLMYDPMQSRNFATSGPATTRNSVVLDSGNLNHSISAGTRLNLQHSFDGTQNRLDMVYFGLNQWEEQAAVRNTRDNGQGTVGNLYSPFTDFGRPPVVGLDYNTLASIESSADLHNAELNYILGTGVRAGRYESEILMGLRYMDIGEQFVYFTQSLVGAGSTNRVEVDTGNDLIGGQLGYLGVYKVSSRWRLDFIGKACLAQNNGRQHTSYFRINNGQGETFETSKKGDATAFVGELGLTSTFDITPHLSGRIGYQSFWVYGLVLGADNFNQNVSVLTQGPAAVDDNAAIVFHGPNVGLEFHW